MRYSFLKILYIINLIFIIKCNEDLYEYAKKYVLDSKWKFYQDDVKIQKNETKIKSIAYEDKLILFEYKESETDCSFANPNSLEDCKTNNTTDNENFWCFLNVTQNGVFGKFNFLKKCIKANIGEIDKFKGISLENYLKAINNSDPYMLAYLSCDSALYKINNLIFYLLSFIFIFK